MICKFVNLRELFDFIEIEIEDSICFFYIGDNDCKIYRKY